LKKFFECDEFIALRRKWYSELVKTGFVDAEDEVDLKEYASSPVKRRVLARKGQSLENQREYYRLAGHFLYEHRFETQLEKTIWQYHAEGMSTRKMEHKVKRKKSYIHEIIMRLAFEMKKRYKVE
jgi:hypothetical protein